MPMNLFDYLTIGMVFIITLIATCCLAERVNNYWEGL